MKQKIKISKIKSNPKNPRLIKDNRYREMLKSVKSFPEMMEKRPIVVDEDMMILGGNMRWKACKEAGFKEVWVDVADDWTQEQKDEFIIKDNDHFGEWDEFALYEEWGTDKLRAFGLDIAEINEDNVDDFEDKFNSINDQNCLYPIVPKYDERQEVFIIVSENEIDSNWLREKLNMQKMKSYKSAELSKSNIIHINDIKNEL
jgi:hypothetical protein